MISVTHYRAAGDDFRERAEVALRILAGKPGYVRGSLGRCTDDDADWVLITEWENVGSYRRALGGYEAKLHVTTLLAEAIDVPSSYEPLLGLTAGQEAVVRTSDREPTG